MRERTDHNEAMRLADAIDNPDAMDHMLPLAAAELRRLSSEFDSLTAERDQLRAEVERLRADGERMDWLERNASDVHAIHDKDGHIQSFQFDCDEGGSLRAAIDAARTTHKETE